MQPVVTPESLIFGIGAGLARKFLIESRFEAARINYEIKRICKASYEAIREKFPEPFQRYLAPIDWHQLATHRPDLEEFIDKLTRGDVHSQPDWDYLYRMYEEEFSESSDRIPHVDFIRVMEALWNEFLRRSKDSPSLLGYHIHRIIRSLDTSLDPEDANKLMLGYCKKRAVLCTEEIENYYTNDLPQDFPPGKIEEFWAYLETPLKREVRGSGPEGIRHEDVSREYLEAAESVILAGDGGVGKTRFLREFEKELCLKYQECQAPGYVPIYFKATEFDRCHTSESLIERIVDKIKETFKSLTGADPGTQFRNFARYLLNNGKIHAIIDAFDQVPDNAERVIAKNLVSDAFLGRCRRIISTRPYDLQDLQNEIIEEGAYPGAFEVIYLYPFDEEEHLPRYFGREYEVIRPYLWDLRSASSSGRTDPKNLLCIPLLARLVKIMAAAGKHEKISSRSQLMAEYMDHVVNTASQKYKKDKEGNLRETKGVLKGLIVKLEGLALAALRKGQKQDYDKSVFDAEGFTDDLVSYEDLTLAERIEFLQPFCDYEGEASINAPTHRFQHLLIQEYLAAKALSKLFLKGDEDGAMDEMKECLSDLRYNTDELSRFLAEMIALEPRRSDRASDCRFWHELMLDPETGDWVRTYAMEIRDRIADEHEDAMDFLEGEFRKEEEEIKRLQAEAEHKAGENEVFVPEGPFIMGSYEYKDERPVRLVQGIGNFYMDKYPVTNREFLEFLEDRFHGVSEPVDEGGHEIIDFYHSRIRYNKNGKFHVTKEYIQHPVAGVTWYGARAFCKWRSQIDKGEIFLPSEEMWEKAARGCLGRRYPWGQGFDLSLCNTYESGIEETTPVTKYSQGRSPYGCYDMAGNVWEWTDSWYDDKYSKVLRGGSWLDFHEDARCADRFGDFPVFGNGIIGFRCARTKR